MSAAEAKDAFYFCPTCKNVAWSQEPAALSCCGKTCESMALSEPNEKHTIFISIVGGDFVAAMNHPMTDDHSIVALIAVSNGRVMVEQLAPGSECVASFPKLGATTFYAICDKHGLFINSDFA